MNSDVKLSMSMSIFLLIMVFLFIVLNAEYIVFVVFSNSSLIILPIFPILSKIIYQKFIWSVVVWFTWFSIFITIILITCCCQNFETVTIKFSRCFCIISLFEKTLFTVLNVLYDTAFWLQTILFMKSWF